MSYTDIGMRPGQRAPSGTDVRELFMRNFSDDVLMAYEETFDFENLTTVKYIAAGISESFPVMGRNYAASEHTPGAELTGTGVDMANVTVTLDDFVVDHRFIADIDRIMNHFELSAPYSRLIGQSLGSMANRRKAITAIKASRVTTAQYPGGPVPSYAYHASMKTDGAQLEEAVYKGLEYIKTNDISGDKPTVMLPWQQQLLLARYTGIDTVETSGSGDRSAGSVGPIAGLRIKGTNSIPNTNLSSGQPGADPKAKYQDNFSTTVGTIITPMAVATLKGAPMKVVMKSQEERLGTLLIGSYLEGNDFYRPECSFELATAVRV